MVSLLLRPLRQLSLALVANESPRQVAWGFTLGMLAGLVPKGNLLAMALFMLLCALRVNKPAGLLALGIFSLVGIGLDPFAHSIGSLLLTWESARPLYAWWYSLPLAPWSGLNNTVVLASWSLACTWPIRSITSLSFLLPDYSLGQSRGCSVTGPFVGSQAWN